jgi:hypothetical protein
MRPNAFTLVVLCVACAAVTSCRRSAGLQEPKADRSFGLFEFTIRNGTSSFSGTLDAREDTMTVQARTGNCFVDRLAPPVIDRVTFRCEGATEISDLRLRFDRRNLQSRSNWSGTVVQWVTKTECTAYRTDERGQRVCTASQTTRTETTAPVSGAIMLQWKAPIP